MVAYTVVLAIFAVMPWVLGLTGIVYGMIAAVLSVTFVIHALRTLRDRQDCSGMSLTGDAPARQMFRFSLIYLFALFSGVVIDAMVA